LGYEKPVSTDAKAKILIGSFLPFSTASTRFDILPDHVAVVRNRGSVRLTAA
jgi:hypothetical protein